MKIDTILHLELILMVKASAKIYNFEQFPFFIFSPGILKIEILASLSSH